MNVRSVAVLITLFTLFTVDALPQANQVPDNIELQVLKDLFDSLGGPSWSNKTNWPRSDSWPSNATSNQFRLWYGVTVINGDITYITLPGNNLRGRLPSSVRFLTRLQRLQLNDNYLTGLPSGLLSVQGLTMLYVNNNELASIPDFNMYRHRNNLELKLENNRLDFSQLERLDGKGMKQVTVTPQKPINDSLTHIFSLSNRLVLTARPATRSTTVTWERLGPDGVTWSALTNDEDRVVNTYTRNIATIADAGTYRWKSTNSIFIGVTIQSDPIVVKTQLGFNLDNWCFQYKYDARGRMTHKKTPGADWVYMVYDDRDRLVMTQDGEQRKASQWTVTKYDRLNRPVITALYTDGSYSTQQDMTNRISKSFFSESYSGMGMTGYTNTVFPITKLEVLTVTYYDDYSFLSGNPDLHSTSKATSSLTAGMTTGMKVKVLDVPYYMTTVNYYDQKGRLVETVSENYDAGIDRVTNIYDFRGKVTATRTTHCVSNLHWRNMKMMDVNGNFIKRGPSGRYGSGSSVEYIPPSSDGCGEATVSEVNTSRYWGLSDIDGDLQPSSIDYCFHLSGTTLRVLEKGDQKMSIASLSPGDRLRISRTGTTISYYRNGELIYISSTPSSTQLRAAVVLVDKTSTILNLNLSTARNTQTTLRLFEYDHAGRLISTRHCINNGDTILLSKNEYNELGQLKNKSLHLKTNGDFSQTIDYRYNIRGWLTSLNADLFGIDLHYNNRFLDIGNTAMFNGNISAMRWRVDLGLADTTMRAYTFDYDPMNRLIGSKQKIFDTQWRDDVAFSEDNLRYDLNGNILGVHRTAAKGTLIDNLTYRYGSGTTLGNQLLKVNDDGDPSVGFVDGNNFYDDYAYDRNGNMTVDNNKGITVAYNILNLPRSVSKKDQGTIQYYYDATGRKLSRVLRDVSGAQKKATDYHGDFIYENDTLKFATTEEGRVVMTDEPEYQYHLKDHLGNVRMTFTTKESKHLSTTGFETASADFLYYNEAVKVNSELFDHTKSGGTHYSARLNGSSGERTGIAKSISVMPGDTVKMEVYVKYLDTNRANWSASLTALITAISSGTARTGTLVDGGMPGSTGGIANPWSGFLDKIPDNDPAPKAYLNYLVFDREYNFVGGDAIRLSSAAREYGQDGPHEKLAGSVLIKKAGYIYIYLSNDNVALGGEQVEVYFDDLKIEHVESPVIQSQDYYPFGLVYNSYSRETSVPNLFLYGGHEVQMELNLSWLDYGARMYAADIGRWLNQDAYSESYFSFSPYNFVRNNPILRIDPTGSWDITVHLHNDREQYGYGIAIVTDRSGNEVFRFVVRAEGTGGRGRSIKNSDTPLGVYDIPDRSDIWRESTNDNRQTYGPNPRLVMNPESGEIVDTGRDAIRIHGGRQEVYNAVTGQWQAIDNPSLKKTHGCLRVFDTDARSLKDITDELMANDPAEIGGKVTVSGDLTDFLKNDGKTTEEQEEQTAKFWKGFDAALCKGLDNLEQWLKANGFK